ncbi:MAG: hypothetical protein ACRENG_08930, partial [bacterium]
IKESFVRTLTGIFHGRIQYPQDQKIIEAPAPEKTRQRSGRPPLATNGANQPSHVRRASSKPRPAKAAEPEAQDLGAAGAAPPMAPAADEA